MKDELKTKKQLIDELLRLREQIAELKEKGKGAQERKKEAKTEEPGEVDKNKKLRILMLEDVAADAELVEHQLQRGGILFSSKRVDTKEGFLKELRDFSPDLILADYSLPQFDGMSALAIAQEQSPEVPFILITGTMGEEFAIETLKKGATDYVLKQRLSRLVPSVKRALREVEEKIELKRAEERLRLLTSVVEQASEGVAVVDLEGNLLFLNDAFAIMHGYTPDELIGKHLSIFHIPEQMPAVEAANREILKKGKFSGKIWHVRRDGTVFPSLMHNSVLRDDAGDLIGMIGTLRDITDIEETEDALKKSKEELNKRIRELEDFYNLAVGRELRMIELKKEIESLKEELQKYKKQ